MFEKHLFQFKINNKKMDIEEAYQIAKAETLKGAILGFAASSGLSLLANRYWPLYRNMTLPGKVMLISIATAGYAGFRGEHSLYLSSRTLAHPAMLAESRTHPELISIMRKEAGTLGLIKRHRVEIIGGVIVAALAASLWHFKENRNRTGAQKFMGIRLFTQGLVIGSALGIVAITQFIPPNSSKESEVNKGPQ
jgi:hypothetical protein